MSGTIRPLSPYLKRLVDDNFLTRAAADIANRLPTSELQEEAIERWEALGVAAMEKVVSEILPPPPEETVRASGESWLASWKPRGFRYENWHSLFCDVRQSYRESLWLGLRDTAGLVIVLAAAYYLIRFYIWVIAGLFRTIAAIFRWVVA